MNDVPHGTYLCHHGIKNQKHGIRRYQNTDGSLTPLGRKHYGIGPSREDKRLQAEKDQIREEKRLAKESKRVQKAIYKAQRKAEKTQHKAEMTAAKLQQKEANKSAKLSAKQRHELEVAVVKAERKSQFAKLSDQEIRDRIERIKLENELRDMLQQETQKANAIATARENQSLGKRFVNKTGDMLKKSVQAAAQEQMNNIMKDVFKKSAMALGVTQYKDSSNNNNNNNNNNNQKK